MNMVRRENDTSLAPQNEAAAVLSIVARAAADPNVDMDKLERLMAMQEPPKRPAAAAPMAPPPAPAAAASLEKSGGAA